MVIGENSLLSLALESAEFLPPEGLCEILGPSVILSCQACQQIFCSGVKVWLYLHADALRADEGQRVLH